MSVATELAAPTTQPSPPAANPTPRAIPARFTVIDSLRGFAALSVCLHHLYNYAPHQLLLDQTLPPPAVGYLQLATRGVQMFFVISGFVIAYSIRHARITPEYYARFALRRSLRLDPPYWATIAVVLALHATLQWWQHVPSPVESVTAPQVVSHFAYLQNVLGHENLSAGFWTLCIEFQFYLLFVMLVGLAQRSAAWQAGHWTPDATPGWLAIWTAPVALASLFWYHRSPDNVDWLSHFFCMFYLGILVCWTLHGQLPRWTFLAYAGLVAGRIVEATLTTGIPSDLCVALATAAFLFALGQQGRLRTGMKWRPLQYLGSRSYSLYLVHYPVSHLIQAAWAEFAPATPFHALAAYSVSLGVSLLVTELFYRGIEQPSVRWANWFKEREVPAAMQRSVAAPANSTVSDDSQLSVPLSDASVPAVFSPAATGTAAATATAAVTEEREPAPQVAC